MVRPPEVKPLDAADLSSRLGRPAGPWRRVDVVEEIDSTNAESQRHPMPWRVVTAGVQRAGRGRRERTWVSPQGASVSLSLTVPLPTGVDAGWFPLLVGLAVRDALTQVGADPVALKWPNDVLAGAQEHKVCGILCQVLPGDLLLAGVGINMVPDPQLQDALASGESGPVAPTPPIALSQLVAEPVRREDVVKVVAQALERRHGAWSAAGMARLREDYRRCCATIGRDVVVHLPGSRVAGRALDVDGGGRLLVRGHDDRGEHAFMAGDVVHIRPGDQA